MRKFFNAKTPPSNPKVPPQIEAENELSMKDLFPMLSLRLSKTTCRLLMTVLPIAQT